MENETPSEALAIVSEIIDCLWDDGQLLSSGLDRKQMEPIAQTFVREWEKTIASTKEN